MDQKSHTKEQQISSLPTLNSAVCPQQPANARFDALQILRAQQNQSQISNYTRGHLHVDGGNSLFDNSKDLMSCYPDSSIQSIKVPTANNQYDRDIKLRTFNVSQQQRQPLYNYPNFDSFTYTNAKRKSTNKYYQSISVGRSTNEWSIDVKDSLNKGLATSQVFGSTRNQSTKYNSVDCKQTRNTFYIDRNESILNFSQLDDLTTDNQLILDSFDVDDDQYEASKFFPKTDKKFHISSKKKQNQFQMQIASRIHKQCMQKYTQQAQNANLASLKRCQVMSQFSSDNRRSSLLKLITERAQPLKQHQCKVTPVTLQSPSKSSLETTDNIEINPDRRKLQLAIQQFESKALLGSSDKLWQQLHQSVTINKKQMQTSALNSKVTSNQTLQTSQSGYRQTKYLGLGKLGEIYARKEYDELMQQKIKEQQHLLAAKTNIFQPWTTERVASRLSQNKHEQIQLLIAKDRGLLEYDEIYKQQGQQKVNEYTNDLSQSINVDFVHQLNQLQQDTHTNKDKTLSDLDSSLDSPLTKLQLLGNPDIRIKQVDRQIIRENQPYEMSKLVDKLNSQMSFQQQCKHFAQKQDGQDNPVKSYFKAANDQSELVLDILNKINEQELVLQQQNLGVGQCTGFMKACQFQQSLLTKLTLDNCGFAPGSLQLLLQGVSYQSSVSQLNFKHISIDNQSAEVICSLLQSKAILQLKIDRCSIAVGGLDILLNGVQQCNLQNLCLAGQTFTKEQIQKLIHYISTATQLKDLNLSCCRLQTLNFTSLLKSISLNSNLEYINLSWCKLLEHASFGTVGLNTQVNDIVECNSLSIQRSNSQMSASKQTCKMQPVQLSQYEQSILDCLLIILKSHKLLHLNLSETGLTYEFMLRLIRPIKNSQSLIGVHLSGNPGLTPEFERKVLLKLNATYEKQLKLDSFQQVIDRNDQGVDLRQNITDIKKHQQLIQQSLYIKEISKFKNIATQQTYDTNLTMRHFILTRKIGHNLEMPGCQEWQLSKDNAGQCYICDLKVYTIFFWSPQIGKLEANLTGLSTEEQIQVAKVILEDREINMQRHRTQTTIDQRLQVNQVSEEQVNDQIQPSQLITGHELDIDKDCNSSDDNQQYQSDGNSIKIRNLPTFAQGFKEPMLYGQFNNWTPQPMILVSQLAKAQAKPESPPDYIKVMHERGLFNNRIGSKSITDYSQLNKKEQSIYAELQEQYRLRFYSNSVWSETLNQLIPYQNPHCTSVSHLKSIDTTQLYIAASFIGSGKQDFVVQHASQFYFHSTLASFRQEPIVFPKIELEQKIKVERNPQVFKDWQIDTPQLVELTATKDLSYWKVEKFVKDPQDVKAINKVIKANYVFLKDLFHIVAAKSTFPSVSSLECCVLISDCNLLTKDFTQGIADTQFIASRVDIEKRGYKLQNQNPLDCNRFEFMECIVRWAQNKYKMTGIVDTIAEATKLLIAEFQQNYPDISAQAFRENKLWQRECNLTLDANKKALRKLYDHLKKKESKLSMTEAIKLMTKRTNVLLSENDAKFCFAMSLQTCPDIIKNGSQRYMYIEFIEFLEMIGRVADKFIVDNETPLHLKMNRILDEWLAIINVQREPSVYYVEGESESDEHE